MADLKFDESLVVVIDDPESTEKVEETIANTLLSHAYVKPSYVGAIAEREKSFPTALEVGGVNVAIPHCDVEHVVTGAICAGILKNPVAWHRMDDPDATCDVSLVFMLALNEPHAHLEMIQKVIGIIQDQELAKELVGCDAPGAYALLKDRLA